jgi:hypothetical protein
MASEGNDPRTTEGAKAMNAFIVSRYLNMLAAAAQSDPQLFADTVKVVSVEVAYVADRDARLMAFEHEMEEERQRVLRGKRKGKRR